MAECVGRGVAGATENDGDGLLVGEANSGCIRDDPCQSAGFRRGVAAGVSLARMRGADIPSSAGKPPENSEGLLAEYASRSGGPACSTFSRERAFRGEAACRATVALGTPWPAGFREPSDSP